jgi:hypothetical protein
MEKSEQSDIAKKTSKIEQQIQRLAGRIEQLKIQWNLFFSGEIRLPPEKERETIEHSIRKILESEYKSPRVNLLVQNLSSSFSLYNNMWLKKMNELETGVSRIPKKTAFAETPPPVKKNSKADTDKKGADQEKIRVMDVSLNDEKSFENFYNRCKTMIPEDRSTDAHRDRVINSLKLKLITQNVVEAKVAISVTEGKLKIKVKK